MGAVDLKRAREARDHLVEKLDGHPGVNGIGISRVDDGYVLKVNVRADGARAGMPTEVDGVAVRVQTVGKISKR